MPKRSNLFQDVVAIIHHHMAGNATVEESAMLADRRTEEKGEVDVAITHQVAGHEVIVSVEATAKGRKATVEWVDQMVAKHEDLPTSELVLVAEAGFAKTARKRAESRGVKTIAPEDWSGDDPGFEIVNRLQSVWPKVVAMTPQRYSVKLRLPDRREQWFRMEPDLSLFADNGVELDALYPLGEADYGSQLGRDDASAGSRRYRGQ